MEANIMKRKMMTRVILFYQDAEIEADYTKIGTLTTFALFQ